MSAQPIISSDREGVVTRKKKEPSIMERIRTWHDELVASQPRPEGEEPLDIIAVMIQERERMRAQARVYWQQLRQTVQAKEQQLRRCHRPGDRGVEAEGNEQHVVSYLQESPATPEMSWALDEISDRQTSVYEVWDALVTLHPSLVTVTGEWGQGGAKVVFSGEAFRQLEALVPSLTHIGELWHYLKQLHCQAAEDNQGNQGTGVLSNEAAAVKEKPAITTSPKRERLDPQIVRDFLRELKDRTEKRRAATRERKHVAARMRRQKKEEAIRRWHRPGHKLVKKQGGRRRPPPSGGRKRR